VQVEWEAWEVSEVSVVLEASVPWVDNRAPSKCQEVQLEQQQLLTHLLELQVQPMLLVQLVLLEPLELQEQPSQIHLPPLVAWEAWVPWVACQASILT
jgi:hypothetical protein